MPVQYLLKAQKLFVRVVCCKVNHKAKEFQLTKEQTDKLSYPDALLGQKMDCSRWNYPDLL